MSGSITFGETRSQKTRDLLDQSIGGQEGIVFACQLLDELLVLVELLEIVCGHSIDTVVLGSINIVLITQNAVVILMFVPSRKVPCASPDAHIWARDLWKLDSSAETLITLGIIVLEADLELDGLQEISLLGVVAVVQQLPVGGTSVLRFNHGLTSEGFRWCSLLHVCTHSGDRDLGHLDNSLPKELAGFSW
jgi:hypothetical protein